MKNVGKKTSLIRVVATMNLEISKREIILNKIKQNLFITKNILKTNSE